MAEIQGPKLVIERPSARSLVGHLTFDIEGSACLSRGPADMIELRLMVWPGATFPVSTMKHVACMLALLLTGALCARAADPEVSLPDLMQGAQQWAQDNLDTNVLNALPKLDDPAVQQFLHDLQQRFQG